VCTRQRRKARIKRFEERQRKACKWIKFGEIAEWCSEEGSILPDENKRAAAFDMLAHDLLDGEFEENGHSRVYCWFLATATARRMTREWLNDAIYNNWDGHHGRLYLAHCWIPRRLFDRWLAKHRQLASPSRFQPQESYRVAGAKARDETAALIAKPGAKGRAVANAIDQLWPNGIPEGLSAKDRNLKIVDRIKLNEGSVPKDVGRAVQRALRARRSR
jgi:hypothetical protein